MGSGSPPEIPGYFWDPKKGRYFKIEKNHHAPRDDAPWSSDNVKKRKHIEAAAAERAWYKVRSVARIARSRVLNEPLMGGFLAREHGDDVRDLRAASFAHGLIKKGYIDVSVGVERRLNVRAFCIYDRRRFPFYAGEVVTGWHPVYAFTAGTYWVQSTALIRHDETGRISECPTPRKDIAEILSPIEPGYSINVSDIKCNSHDGFVCSDSLGKQSSAAIWKIAFRDVGPSLVLQQVQYTHRLPCTSTTLCLPPSGHSIMCFAGTNLGLAGIDAQNQMKLLTPTDSKSKNDSRLSFYNEIFGVDHDVSNPNVVFFGGRNGLVFTGDLRQDPYDWSSIQVPRSIAHVKAVNDNQVLVAGLDKMMSVYDTRFCDRLQIHNIPLEVNKRRRGGNPIVTMAEYKSHARFYGGFDLDRSTGIAAAAHEDGKVALYSVRSGRRLPSRAIDSIHSQLGRINRLQFKTFENDHTPTLFVGDGTKITGYSFGVDNDDDEC
ncbi:hypothetical protein F4805DRAFT_342848 [Annulohypoxylon moriforme]|nr:hypothetical protein F4805DRAFT_342848 [Annulohypoxylon moriforme]